MFCFIFNNKYFQILVHYYYLLLPPSWMVLIAFSLLLLLVATTTLDGFTAISDDSNFFPYYCFKLLAYYFHTFILYYCCATVLSPSALCPFPFYGIRAILFWPVIVLLCFLSLRLCLPETLILFYCVTFLLSLAPP